jgi:hypothetical protein
LANLDFYNKEIANIQGQLLDKLDNLVAGLGQVTDTELMQIAKQIDFFDEMERLGYGRLLQRVSDAYDNQIALVFSELNRRELGAVSVASIDTLRELKNFEMTYLTGQAKQYADQLKTAMLRGIITGETNAQIMAGLQTGFGVGTFISSSETSFLINDAFATFSSATRAKAFEEFPDITFQYIGARKDEKTRDSCKWILNNNKPRTQKEIKELKVPPRKDGSKHSSFNRRGGYNCRHRWVRV